MPENKEACKPSPSAGKPAVQPQHLTRKGVANRIGVHVETIKRWERAGKITPVYFGPRTIRYPLAYVEQWELQGCGN